MKSDDEDDDDDTREKKECFEVKDENMSGLTQLVFGSEVQRTCNCVWSRRRFVQGWAQRFVMEECIFSRARGSVRGEQRSSVLWVDLDLGCVCCACSKRWV